MGKHPNCSYNKERSVCFELFVEKILSALKVILFEFELAACSRKTKFECRQHSQLP